MNSKLQQTMRAGARYALATLLVATVVACGGGKSDSGSSAAPTPPPPAPLPADPVMSKPEAARFLAQATFGPTEATIDDLSYRGFARWIDEQMALPQEPHRTYVDARTSDLQAIQQDVAQAAFRESYWKQAMNGEGQLRQRAAFALSQIFVVSFNDAKLNIQARGVTTFYDMLGEQAFGNYRDLLERVSLHPMMGAYLTSVRNQNENASGRVPDENYAREIMQLFSIGLYELNDDGTLRGGAATETYTHEDIKGLAKVFTGWGYYAGPNLANRSDTNFTSLTITLHPQHDWRPMQAYNQFHSTSEKRFLGVTIPASTTADAAADLKIALDTLFNHRNVGPFIGRQLIQRMVTSNPSPAYVGRVAAAFNNNGAGVRGDMKAVFRAILLDPEARNFDASSNSFGKVREPVLRLSHLLRAFKASSYSGYYTGIDNTDTTLSQTPLLSPTVFNYFRPGYVPANSAAANAGLVVPELQLANEVSVATYLNYLRGTWLTASATRDVQLDFSAEFALADKPTAANPTELIDRLNLLLMSGQMSAGLRAQVLSGVVGRTIPATGQANIDTAKRDRVSIAILLIMASPEYLVQK